jgi:hypothetical protein
MTGKDSTVLDDAVRALMGRRVSIIVASRDGDHRPHLMRAIGWRPSTDHRRVSVLMTARTSSQLLDDVRSNRAISVVFSEPTTHHSVQLKGSDAVIEPTIAGDEPLIDAYAQRLAEELGQLGYSSAFVHALLDRSESDVVAVTFTPTHAFEQTPGPRAGAPLARRAGEQ